MRAVLIASGLLPSAAWAANDAFDGDGTMVVSPTQVQAGSLSNSYVFAWRNAFNGKFNAGSQCTLFIPAGWTAPQNTNPNNPGFVSVTPVGQASAAIISIAGGTSWTVTVDFTANQSDRHGFDLTYAGSGTRVTAPAQNGLYTFVTRTRQGDGTLTPIASSPAIMVTGGIKADQTISFPAIPNQWVTDKVGLAAAADSRLPVSFSVGSGPALITGATNLTFTGVGTVRIVASQAGDANWNPAPNVTNTFSVLDIESGGGGLETFANFAYTGSTYVGGTFLGQDGSTWTYAKARGDLSLNGRAPTLDKAKGAFVRSGAIPGGVGSLSLKYKPADNFALNCIIHVNGTRVGALTGKPVGVQTWTSGTLNVQGRVVLLFTNSANSGPITLDDISWTPYVSGPRPAVVTLHNLSQGYDGTPRVVTATTEPPGLTVSLTYDGLAEPPTDAGAYAILATVTDPGYTGYATGTLVVAKADQAIVFPPIGDKITTDLVGLSATASSGLAVSFAVASGPGIISDGTNLAFTGAGAVTITASQAGDENWNPAPNVAHGINVTKAVAGVTLNNLNQSYDGTPRAVTATTEPPGLTVDLTYDGSPYPPADAGSYEVVGTVNDAMYQGAQVGTLTIGKATAGVTLQNLSQTYNGAPRVVTATTEPPGLTVDLTYDGSPNPPADAGGYSVVATVVDPNYAGTASGFLVVNKADQIITFPNPGPQKTTNQVGLSATASSGLGVTFDVVSGPGVISQGTNLSFTGAGTVNVAASQAGNANWNAAPNVTRTLEVTAAFYVLTVQSAHGTANPAAGDHPVTPGTMLTNTVQGSSMKGATQYVCAGWTMADHAPEHGEGSQFVMTVTNNAVLTWRWATNYWLTTDAGSHGSVNVSSGWQKGGVITQITATADQYYRFSGWTGDVVDNQNPLNLVMNGSKSITAHFAEIRAGRGTPIWWLAMHYPNTNDFEAAELSDTDGDGYSAWQEYIAGTVPTNRVCNMKFCPAKQNQLSFQSRVGRLYTIYYKTNLTDPNWLVLTNNIPGTGEVMVIPNGLPTAIYRLKVTMP